MQGEILHKKNVHMAEQKLALCRMNGILLWQILFVPVLFNKVTNKTKAVF